MSARTITVALKGRWCGSYGMACCPAHDDRTPSLKITDSEDDDVVVHCFAGCGWQDVKDVMRSRGLLPDFEPGQRTQRQPKYRDADKPDPQKLANIEHAKEIWATTSSTSGTYVETYLRSRGITIPIPPTIKYSPALKHRQTGVAFPAMIAAISKDRKLTGVHRTYLRFDGARKAPLSKPKLALGRLPGDAVRLGPVAEEIGICEGIETGLSAMQIYGGSVWCACGSALDKIALPADVERVRIYADNGEPGQEAAAKAVDVYRHQGRDVTIISPPPEYGDFNDVLTTAREAAA